MIYYVFISYWTSFLPAPRSPVFVFDLRWLCGWSSQRQPQQLIHSFIHHHHCAYLLGSITHIQDTPFRIIIIGLNSAHSFTTNTYVAPLRSIYYMLHACASDRIISSSNWYVRCSIANLFISSTAFCLGFSRDFAGFRFRANYQFTPNQIFISHRSVIVRFTESPWFFFR